MLFIVLEFFERSLTLFEAKKTLINQTEREGVEPSMSLTPYTISSRAPSATRTPLHGINNKSKLLLSINEYLRILIRGIENSFRM